MNTNHYNKLWWDGYGVKPLSAAIRQHLFRKKKTVPVSELRRRLIEKGVEMKLKEKE